MTLADMHRLVAYVQAHFPGVSIPDDTVKAYQHSLQNIDAKAVLSAVNEHLRRSRFMPSIAEILDVLAERALKLDPPEQAWLEVERAVRRWGRHTGWRFDNPAIDLATEAIGKLAICDATASERGTLRAHWLRTYASFVATEIAEAKRALVGGFPFVSVLDARRKQALAGAERRVELGPRPAAEAVSRVLPAGGDDEPPEAA